VLIWNIKFSNLLIVKLVLLNVFLLALSSCISTQLKAPDLNQIYDVAAKQSDEFRNPVIVIPGILGSKLYDQEEKMTVWGVFNGQFSGPNSAESTRQVALPMEQGKELRDLKDNVISTGALDRIRLKIGGVPLEPRAYAAILATLGAGGYKDQELGKSGAIDYGDEHFTCFQFHYDWRRSNAENAVKLDQFIKEKKRYVRVKFKERFGYDKKDIKFDIVSHSMGGLVARYYLRYGKQPLSSNGAMPKLNWSGAKNVEKLIIVGTPSNGSVSAFEQLLNGQNFAPKWTQFIPFTNIPKYPAGVTGTYPSVYELMARVRHGGYIDSDAKRVNVYDPELWKQQQWGLLSEGAERYLRWMLPDVASDEERKKIAYDHVRKCLKSAKRFHDLLDSKVKKPEHLHITLIAGDAIQTKERIKIDLSNGTFEDNHYTPGDGVVLRSSVLADQRAGSSYQPGVQSSIDYNQVLFLPREHIELTKDKTFSDNVLHILLEED